MCTKYIISFFFLSFNPTLLLPSNPMHVPPTLSLGMFLFTCFTTRILRDGGKLLGECPEVYLYYLVIYNSYHWMLFM